MGEAYITRRGGGGGGGLNFRVIGGTSAPANPKDNDIWVNTETEVTSFCFSTDIPVSKEITTKAALVEGYINKNGAVESNSSYIITHYVELPADATSILVRHNASNSNGVYHEFSDANKKKISLAARAAGNVFYKIPDGAAYVRLSLRKSLVDADPLTFAVYTDEDEGMVWFSTDTSSPVAFNALKNNGITVYPTAAKQHIDGELVSVPAYCYQSGEWLQLSKSFDGYLFNNGSVNEDITGGWSAGSGAMVGNTLYGDYYKAPSTEGAICSTVKKVDLTEYNTLKVNCTEVTGTAILSIKTDTNQVATKTFTTTGVTELNISAVSGEHYIRIASSGVSDGDYTVDKVWLE